VYRYKYVQKNLSRKRKIGPPPAVDPNAAGTTVTGTGTAHTAGTQA
jgi:ribose transport system permease protein